MMDEVDAVTAKRGIFMKVGFSRLKVEIGRTGEGELGYVQMGPPLKARHMHVI